MSAQRRTSPRLTVKPRSHNPYVKKARHTAEFSISDYCVQKCKASPTNKKSFPYAPLLQARDGSLTRLWQPKQWLDGSERKSWLRTSFRKRFLNKPGVSRSRIILERSSCKESIERHCVQIKSTFKVVSSHIKKLDHVKITHGKIPLQGVHWINQIINADSIEILYTYSWDVILHNQWWDLGVNGQPTPFVHCRHCGENLLSQLRLSQLTNRCYAYKLIPGFYFPGELSYHSRSNKYEMRLLNSENVCLFCMEVKDSRY
ncbi:hypothetical protein YC2023_015088 [Brassica napus]